METRIYTGKEQKRVIEESDYKGYHYAIVSYGTHPCCYVKVDDDGTDYEYDSDIRVHGGITFQDKLNHLENLEQKGYYIGWDYAHAGDYYAGSMPDGRVYTMDVLREDVRSVIDQLERARANKTDGRFFSEDLYSLVMGEMTAEDFRDIWGNEIEYDAMNGIINVGDNTIITNED